MLASLHAQLNLHPTSPKEKRLLKKRVLHKTDHFYFGMETGVVFLLGEPTGATAEAQQNILDAKPSKLGFRLGFSFIETSKCYVGYAFKSHNFELASGGIMGIVYARVRPYGPNKFYPTMHGTLMVRYYYRLPIRSHFVKLLIGPELGWAYRMPSIFSGYKSPESPTYPLVEHAPAYHNLVAGINIRADLKLAKNCTFNFQINYCAALPNRSEFRLYEDPYPTSPYTTYYNTIMNLNLSFGLKFDFYSKKKKQQTFEKLGIEDPYKK